jgi:hypothetical protein
MLPNKKEAFLVHLRKGVRQFSHIGILVIRVGLEVQIWLLVQPVKVEDGYFKKLIDAERLLLTQPQLAGEEFCIFRSRKLLLYF